MKLLLLPIMPRKKINNKTKATAGKKTKPKNKVLTSVSKLTKRDLKGTRVLLRADLNVPIVGGRVQNDFRIVQSLPTIKFLTERGARVVIVSHLGDGGPSLKPVAERLNKYISAGFYPGLDAADVVRELPEGGVLLLENLRRDKGEEKNNPVLAKKLASLGDIYVNDAFAVSHRPHASVVGVPKLLPSYAGFLLESEISHLTKAFKAPQPFLFVLGGAKFSTKMPLVTKFIPTASTILISGALANDLYKARGLEVGRSLVDKDMKSAKNLLKEAKIITPEQVMVSGFSIATKPVTEVTKQDVIVDAGSDWLLTMEPTIKKAKFILWNGTIGNFENGYTGGTKLLAKMIADSKAFSVVGGGDTISAIEELGLMEAFSFISTGGGAMLDFLANGTLPGIEALKK